MLSEVPDGWKEAKLGDCFDIKSSKRVLQKQWRNEGIPFYRGREITSLAEQGYVDNELFIERELYEEFASKHGVPKCGDILITAIGTIGNTYVVRESDRFYFKDASVLWLMRASDNLSALVNYWFQSELFFNQLDRGNGTTVDSLTISKLKSLSLALPPINEQKRIAEILSSVDESIQATQAVIEQAERVKRGLMEELLTGGLGSEAVSRGEVPERWVQRDFNTIFSVKNRKDKQIQKQHYSDEGEFPIIDQSSSFIAGYCDGEPNKDYPVIIFGDHTRAVKYIDFPFFSGADGTQALYPAEGLDTKFSYYLLQNTELPNLGYSRHMRELKRVLFPIPPFSAQQGIAEILSSVDQTIASHKANIEQQSRVKKGLMDDLLTGKVRTV